VFESKSYNLYPGSDTDLPEVAELLRAFPNMLLSVEGHVNFGTRTDTALDISKGRARAVRVRLMSLGVDRARLRDVGHGFSKPRYPRGSALAGKNRRVQFVILNPEECLN
jgi:outer membrane protein OmpA-like peptidoglycan-associated protein